MALVGKLEEIPFSEILELLALSRKTGRLTVNTGTEEALIVFRDGKIIYSASSTTRETFGSIVTGLGLLSHEDLARGLRAQHRSREEKRLGRILVEMKLLDMDDLTKACQQQVIHVLKEIMSWEQGFFRFKQLEIPDHGEVEVDALNLVLDRPVDARQAVFDAAKEHDEKMRDTDPELLIEAESEPPDRATLSNLMDGVSSPSITAEMVSTVLNGTSGLVRRAVVLSVRGSSIQGLAQLGLDLGDRAPSQRVRAIRLPKHEESVLALAVATGQVYHGPLQHNRWNEAMAKQLGGGWPQDVVVLPIRVDGVVRMLLYGDNLPIPGPIQTITQLKKALNRVEELVGVEPSVDAEGLTLA